MRLRLRIFAIFAMLGFVLHRAEAMTCDTAIRHVLHKLFPNKFADPTATRMRTTVSGIADMEWGNRRAALANATAISQAKSVDEVVQLLIQERGPEYSYVLEPHEPNVERSMASASGPAQLVMRGKGNTSFLLTFKSADAIKKYYAGDLTNAPTVSVIDVPTLTSKQANEGLMNYSNVAVPAAGEVNSLVHVQAFASAAMDLYGATPLYDTYIVRRDNALRYHDVPNLPENAPNESSYKAVMSAKLEALAERDPSWKRVLPSDLTVGSSLRGVLNPKSRAGSGDTSRLIEFNGTITAIKNGKATVQCGLDSFELSIPSDDAVALTPLYMKPAPKK